MYNHFKKLYIVKLCERYNRNVASTLDLKPNQVFLINKYKDQAKFFDESELKSIIDGFISLDASYKLGQIDLNVGIESLLCRYCS